MPTPQQHPLQAKEVLPNFCRAFSQTNRGPAPVWWTQVLCIIKYKNDRQDIERDAAVASDGELACQSWPACLH